MSKETIELKFNPTSGRWESRGNRIFVHGGYNCVATVSVQKGLLEKRKDIEQLSNINLMTYSKEMYNRLKEIQKDLTNNKDVTDRLFMINHLLNVIEAV